MSDVPALTILILCRDEENSIAHCVGEAREFLDRRAIAGEVVVLDNGSRDRSAALAEAAGARVVEGAPGRLRQRHYQRHPRRARAFHHSGGRRWRT